MNWAWTSSLDQIWRSPTFPMWLTLAAAGFFGIVVLVTLLRAEKSVANGALTVITLLSIAVAVAATIRGFTPGGQAAPAETRTAEATSSTLPALACVDDLAGDAVLNACEKVLFGSAESAAAAVSYASAQISRLTSFGDLATADRNATTEVQALRRAVEHDRYGLMAYVLMARDHCTPTACPAFRSLGDNHQVVANMNDRTYENLITRYAASWNAPLGLPPTAAGLVAGLPPSMPTGRPTNAEFPSSASTPPVSIMTTEPAKPPAAAPPPARPAVAAKRSPAPKRAPVQLAPPPAAPAAPAPAAANQD
ncbi:hypothetical protein AS156_20390 [Bradyrhizobium macuxiense]|uniref:Uncharacterized protein n=1 Tax=Bradyrhizobium macuxiense TaxID=1755647 RepID=A0A109JDA2_9BRAD|nr:hypothetical protein [Bradyrhizobium macuxiense]KWV46798.1 hypothetical protein AS156_20390 [Bradyrhizobium macuxiense]